MDDFDENSCRFFKITRRSSLTIGLRNITNKTVMFKVHSNPRAGPNYPLSGLLLPGEQNNHKINKMYDLYHLSKYLIDNQGVQKYTILHCIVLMHFFYFQGLKRALPWDLGIL